MQFIFSERRLLVIDMKGATFGFTTWGGGGVTATYGLIIYVCAAVKGMVFKQFVLA